jgi:hypothetical protein
MDAICTGNARSRHGLRADSMGSLLPAAIDAWGAHRDYGRCADALGSCYESCTRSPSSN